MRKFLAVCCCLIVGLEILVAVPMAVIGAYIYGAASTSIVMAEGQPVYQQAWPAAPASYAPAADAPSPSPLAPALPCTPYASTPAGCETPAPKVTPAPAVAAEPNADSQRLPLAYAPSALPAPTYNPYVNQPASPSLCPAPSAVAVPSTPYPQYAPATSFQPPQPVAAVAQLAAAPAAIAPTTTAPAATAPAATVPASGSVSDDTVAAAPPPRTDVQPEPQVEPQPEAELQPHAETDGPTSFAVSDSPAAAGDVQQLVAGWVASALQHSSARVCAETDCETAACTECAGSPPKSSHDKLVESLLETAQHLYHEANRCEEAYDFNQADRVRMLARDLRLNVMEMQQKRQEANARVESLGSDRHSP